MMTLTVFYDPRCGLCCRFRQWMEQQRCLVATRFVDFRSDGARRVFPRLDSIAADKQCVVLADDGRWWQGPEAWVVCLWATREYRPWARRLAGRVFRPVLDAVVHLVSENRLTLSRLMMLRSDADLVGALVKHRPECADGCGFVPKDQMK